MVARFPSLAALLIALASLTYAAFGQATSCSTVQLTLLHVQWTSLPQYNGSSATVALTFYSSCEYHAVTFTAQPQCPYLSAGMPTFVQTISPNAVFTVPIQLYVRGWNTTCPINVVAYAQYGSDYSHILGAAGVYGFNLYVPPYPTFAASASGEAYLGLPSAVNLTIYNPYRYPARITLSGQSSAVLSPSGPVAVADTTSLPVVVVPYSTSAVLLVTVRSQDYLGNPVEANYAVPLAVAQPPPAAMDVSPSTLYLNQLNNVTITIKAPFRANGTAAVIVSGASLGASPVVVPITNGVGKTTISLIPIASPVVFQASVAYYVMGFQQSASASASVQAVQPSSATAEFYVSPQILIANAPNNLTITIRARGPFSASVTVGGASAGVPMPLYLSGVGEIRRSLVVYPTSPQVSVTVTIQTGGGLQQYTAYLTAASANIFLAVASPPVVRAGGNRTITVRLINEGNIPVERGVLVVTPASSSVLMGTAVFNFSSLRPLDSVQFPLSFLVPAGAAGALAFQYTVYYTTPTGSGQAQGAFYVQSVQLPSVLITSASVAPQSTTAGSPFFVSLTVVNNGFLPVNNLQIEVRPPAALIPLTQTLSYIGGLATQQSQTATFSFNATEPGRYSLPVVVSYQDQYGNSYAQTVYVNVTVAGNPTGGSLRTSSTSAPGGAANYAAAAAASAAAVALIIVGIWRSGRKSS